MSFELGLFLENDYDFLDYHSYADCVHIHPKKKLDLSEIIVNNPTVACGKLLEKDLSEILKILRNSRILSVNQKRKFGLFD